MPSMAVSSLCPQWHSAIVDEICEARKQGGHRIRLAHGEELGISGARYLYRFRADQEVHVPDGCGIEVQWDGHVAQGEVLSVEGFDVFIAVDTPIDSLNSATLVVQLWYILERLDDRLTQIASGQLTSGNLFDLISSENVTEQVTKSQKPFSFHQNKLNSIQKQVITKVFTSSYTFIWGPPGTGKTFTLGHILSNSLERNESCLLVSYSNVAVDEAVLKAAAAIPNLNRLPIGTILRYGVPRREKVELLPGITVVSALRQLHPDIYSNLEKLRARRKHLISKNSSVSSKELESISAALSEIREFLRQEEDRLARSASVLCCTLAKAAVASLFERSRWDIIVLDEASMASIPYAAYSACLGNNRFVISGDFRQLPPVTLSDSLLSKKWLQRDIFEHSGIPDVVKSGVWNHPRLVLLEKQYRMHPTISSLISNTFYYGRLRDDPEIVPRVAPIVSNDPYKDSAVILADISSLPAKAPSCESSRYNIFSAIVTASLCGQAISNNSPPVALISPFRIQSRLLRKISLDANWGNHSSVATVHKFQGSESNIVIVDLTTSPPHSPLGPLLSGDEYSLAGRLLNVAFSRAKGKLIVVANVKHIRRHSHSSNAITKLLFRIGQIGKTDAWNLNRLFNTSTTNYLPGITLHKTDLIKKVLSDKRFTIEQELAITYPSNDYSPPPWLEQLTDRGVRLIIGIPDHSDRWRQVPGITLWSGPTKSKYAAIADRKILWLDLGGKVLEVSLPETAAYLADLLNLIPSEQLSIPLGNTKAMARKGPLGLRCTCGGMFWLRDGRYGPYLSCTTCGRSQSLNQQTLQRYLTAIVYHCEACGASARACSGPKGLFVGCSRFPKCKWTLALRNLV